MLSILQDTREQTPWEFSDANVKVQKLSAGDYTLESFEDYIIIERKASTAEIAINLGKEFSRFEREMIRLKSICLVYIVCEFSLQDLLNFPKGSNIKPSLLKEVRINGKYMVKLLSTFPEKYGVEVIYAGNRENAISKVEEIFETVQKIGRI